MGKTISASVGFGGANRTADVRTIQELLNGVAAAKGGPLPPLDVDGACGPLTVEAIRRFQTARFGPPVDARVDPGQRTLEALNGASTSPSNGSSSSPGVPPPLLRPTLPTLPKAPTGATTNAQGLRSRIVEIATAEATPAPGKVSDLVTMVEPGTQKIVRAGWRQLQRYFDEGVDGWTPNHWKDPQTLAGVQIPGKRVPQQGTTGVSWCGIFATWVLQQAGLPVKWRVGVGVTTLEKRSDKLIQVGDVAVMQGDKVHHCIPVAINGTTMTTVNGNSDNQSILIKQHSLSNLWYYYRAPE